MTILYCLVLGFVFLDDAKDSERLINEAQQQLRKGEAKKALETLSVGEKKDPKNPQLPLVKARVLSALGQHRESVVAFSRALELDPANAELYDERGSAHFKAGQFKESASDFDRYVKLRPAAFNGHWRRGITLWYAGKFDDGRKQFEGYEKVDTNDVENAVWHFLCVARKDGVEKARAALLKIGRDRRVPMMTVYELFKGTAKTEDVLKAVEEGNPDAAQKTYRLFYAHLYLGIWFDLTGDAKKGLTHLEAAVEKGRIHPYMWEVARVHRDLLAAKKP